MAQYNYLKNNFTGGKVGARLNYRSDLVRHKNGCAVLNNFILMTHGGVRSRTGTKFIAEAKYHDKDVRLLDFQAGINGNYVIEFGENYFRFIKDGEQLGAPYEIAHTYTEAQLHEVRTVQSVDVLYIMHGDHPPRVLRRLGDTNWELEDYEFTDGPYLSASIGETSISRTASSGTITITSTEAIFQPTDTSGTGGTGKSDRHIRLFDVDGEWRSCKIVSYTSATEVEIEIQEIDGEINDFSGHGAGHDIDTYRLGSWSSSSGYPQVVAFYENRLILANTSTEPETVWGSSQDDYVRFTPDVNDADSVSFVAVAEKLNDIQWLSPAKTLRIGTSNSEFDMSGGSSNLAITPTNVRMYRATNYGSIGVEPILVENSTLFWQRSGKILREYQYSFQQDNFVAEDLTIVSEDIAFSGAREQAYQAEPDNVVWVCTNDGSLLGLTYMRSQEVVGWHTHTLGGTDVKVKSVTVVPANDEDLVHLAVERTINGQAKKYIECMDKTFARKTIKDAYFVDCGVHYRGDAPTADLTPSEITGESISITASSAVFAATDVGRYIRSGEAKAKIVGYTSGTEITANVLRDFSSTSTIAEGEWTLSTDIITGLSHLEGETLRVLADGGVHPDVTVVSGEAQLTGQYTDVAIGLGYDQELQIVPIDYSSNLGTQLGSRSRITETSVFLFETVGGEIGKDIDNTTPIYEVMTEMDEGTPLVTGERVLRTNHHYKDSAQFAYVQRQPLPATLLGFSLKLETSNAR